MSSFFFNRERSVNITEFSLEGFIRKISGDGGHDSTDDYVVAEKGEEEWEENGEDGGRKRRRDKLKFELCVPNQRPKTQDGHVRHPKKSQTKAINCAKKEAARKKVKQTNSHNE